MSVAKAKAYYTDRSGSMKLNCAQAVIAAFREKFGLDENAVHLFASFGSGRAPGGECGALCAAKFLLSGAHQDKIEECGNTFMSKAGSVKCKEIRQLKKLPCVGCVETIAGFLDKIENNNAGVPRAAHDLIPENLVGSISLERQIRIGAGILVLAGILLSVLISRWFLGISLFVACGLIYAGLTDSCMMGMLLMKLPYYRPKRRIL